MAVPADEAGNVLHLEFGAAFDGLLSLRNALGQDVFEKPLSNATRFDLPTTGFAPGLYRLLLRGRDGSISSTKVLLSR